jgi:hypothetical protein
MRVLEDDDYYSLPWDPTAWQIGDVVLYRKKDDPTREIRHVAIIAEKRPLLESGEFDVWVVSAWRDHGEYFHRIGDVQPILGQPSQVVSQRVIFP